MPVLDYVVPTQSRLAHYRQQLRGLHLHLVVLAPGAAAALQRDRDRPEKQVAAHWTWLEDIFASELAGTGLWLDTAALTADETFDAILDRRREAWI